MSIKRRTANTRSGKTRSSKRLRTLRRHDRGSMGVMAAAVVIPLMIGFGTLTIGKGYYEYRNLLLKQTIQAAALAAGNKLGKYYGYDETRTTVAQRSVEIIAAAKTLADVNMPPSQYGNVLTATPANNVKVGNWNSTTSTFTALTTSLGSAPDAVQVIGYSTAANSNPINLFIGSWFGKPSADASTTVIASYGNGIPFNTVVVNDMSQSFSSELSNSKQADQTILDCVTGISGTSSQFGITLANGHSTLYQALSAPGAKGSTNYTTLAAKITALTATSCNQGGVNNCGTGSNIASGMYSAIQQLRTLTSNKNMIIITDGVPNANNGVNYQQADGIYPVLDSTVNPICQGAGTGAGNCDDTDLLTMAQKQAKIAKDLGISISTIYYSGSTTNASDRTDYANKLATLVTLNGIAMVEPNAAQLKTTISGFCSTIPSALKAVF